MIDLEEIKRIINERNRAVVCYDLFVEFKPMSDAFEFTAFYKTERNKQQTSIVIPSDVFINMTKRQVAVMIYLNRKVVS